MLAPGVSYCRPSCHCCQNAAVVVGGGGDDGVVVVAVVVVELFGLQLWPEQNFFCL